MAAEILKGKPIADAMSEEIRASMAEFKKQEISVAIAAVQVGQDPASEFYIRNQKKQAEAHGIGHQLHQLPDGTTQAELLAYIQKLNADPKVTGIILLTPLPKPLDAWSAQIAIDPKKDIEGIHPVNLGMLVYNQQRLAPCTALAAVKMIEASGVDTVGAETVIVGRSAIVGKPAALLLLERKLSANGDDLPYRYEQKGKAGGTRRKRGYCYRRDGGCRRDQGRVDQTRCDCDRRRN